MNYYFIAGEASGDLHGSNLISALKEQDPEANFRAWGGDRMKEAGAELVRHYRETAFMGFMEVFLNLRRILKLLRECKGDLLEHRPDVLILIDYPGFNLRMAEFAHENGIKVFYYISPQVWAWKKGRVKKIREVVDRMFAILPFEKEFYARYGYDVEFVGHPLVDAVESERKRLPSREDFLQELGVDERPIIALFPGSREQEVKRMLPVMLAIKAQYPDRLFLVGKANSLPRSLFEDAERMDGVHVLEDRNQAILEYAEAALVTSGTATLEAGIIGTPLVVCYSGSALSFRIAKNLVNVPFISLVNLIMERQIACELIQKELSPERLKEELDLILPGGADHERMKEDLRALREKLGGPGASEYTAERMLALLKADTG